MATLSSLKPLWPTLTDDERVAIVKAVRIRRLETKPPKTKAVKERREEKSSTLRTLENMSAEELDILIKKMEEKKR